MKLYLDMRLRKSSSVRESAHASIRKEDVVAYNPRAVDDIEAWFLAPALLVFEAGAGLLGNCWLAPAANVAWRRRERPAALPAGRRTLDYC